MVGGMKVSSGLIKVGSGSVPNFGCDISTPTKATKAQTVLDDLQRLATLLNDIDKHIACCEDAMGLGRGKDELHNPDLCAILPTLNYLIGKASNIREGAHRLQNSLSQFSLRSDSIGSC